MCSLGRSLTETLTGMRIVGGVGLVSAVLLAAGVAAAAPASPAPVRTAPVSTAALTVKPCSAGLVALTFDDGPARALTPKLVGILRANQVPATFFMVGSRVRTNPDAARLIARAGFTIGNHTWSHPKLTRLPNSAVRTQLRSTARELGRRGIRPSRLMRPPYGDINARVRRDIRAVSLVPVLWDVDSRDWRGGSARQIAGSILRQLRPHRSNIVLQHDGVRNSPASIAAVPMVIRAARRRGYCFAALGPGGRMATPVPSVTGEVQPGGESGATPARVLVRLSSPTSRVVSLRLTVASGTATAGEDFVPLALRVSFPVGTTSAWVDVPVIDDATYEPSETFRVVLDAPSGVVIARNEYAGTITSDDPAPVTPAP
jgi:peptidoglycan/xylan/chitin deacetylase (PgdA/CDA1 family)